MHMLRFTLKALLSLFGLSLLAAQAAANYSGTYVTNNPAQTLTLSQAQDGTVSGELRREAETLRITLGPLDNQLAGAAQDVSGNNFPVLAQLHQNTLYFKIYQADAQGNVLSETGVQYEFYRAQPKPNQTSKNWAGSYTNSHGGQLVLRGSGSSYDGALRTDGTSYPVQVQLVGQTLEGTFVSGAASFPLRISRGTEAGQIVVESEGAVIEMSRADPNPPNPLVATPQTSMNPLSATSPQQSTDVDLSGNFRHPDGYFAMNVPPNWAAEMMSGDVFALDTGYQGALTLILMAELEPDEIGKPAGEIVKSAHDMVDELLRDNFSMLANSNQAQINLVPIGGLPGGVSNRPAQGPNGAATIWQGVVVQGKSAFVMMSAMPSGIAKTLNKSLDAAMRTVRLNRSWELSEFVSSSGRRVSFNGKALTDDELARIEGNEPIIPDGAYWYDNRSGMAGTMGGPTEAYLAPGLNLGGPLAANSSGGGSSVAFNGRYLHPIDLAGLEMYFGQIRSGRYWLDGKGNYGQENGPKLGNLVEEISTMQMLAAAAQVQYQQQLNAAVEQYQGMSFYGQGGGYYGQGGGYQQGGGSVYSHFPNLGASGSGVSVANAGGGDTIVNAGGVLWWPGK